MQAVIKKWGNSASLRIPATLLKAVSLDIDSPVELKEENGRLIIEPIGDSIDLKELIAGITADNVHAEVDFGQPVGKEVL